MVFSVTNGSEQLDAVTRVPRLVARGYLFSLVVAALLALAGPAQASTSQETIVQDDRMLLNFGVGVQSAALDELDTLGVDTVHAVINWDRLAPKPSSSKPPKGFNGRDPESYNQARWAAIDSLVRQTQARGIDLLLTPSG